MNAKVTIPGFALGLLIFAVYHVVQAKPEVQRLTPTVEPARPERTPSVRRVIAAAGVVEPRSEVITIGSDVAGVVETVFVKVGDRVRKGDPMFALDGRKLRADLKVREAERASAQAEFDKLERLPRREELPIREAAVREVEAEFLDQEAQCRRAALLVGTRCISEEEFQKRKQAYRAAKARLDRARAELDLLKEGAWAPEKLCAFRSLEQARVRVEQIRTDLERLIVRAPIDAEVLQVNVRPGEYAGSAAGLPLLILGDTAILHVRVDVDESDVPRFRPGVGRASPRGDPQQSVDLKFVRTERMLVPKKSLTGANTERTDTRVLQVIYRVKRGSARLIPGMQLDVFLPLPEAETETESEAVPRS